MADGVGARWAGLELGDVVAQVGRTLKMVVVDLDLDDAGQVTCAWRSARRAGRGGQLHERTHRVSALILVRRRART